MRGGFLDETAAGVLGARDGDCEGAEFWVTTGVSSETGRLASPEKISSPACFPSEAGRSGEEAAESRVAAKDKAAWGSGAPVLAGDVGERALGVAGFTALTALTATTDFTATEGDSIDGANGNDMNDGDNDKPEPLVRGDEPCIGGNTGTKPLTLTDCEPKVTTRVWANAELGAEPIKRLADRRMPTNFILNRVTRPAPPPRGSEGPIPRNVGPSLRGGLPRPCGYGPTRR